MSFLRDVLPPPLGDLVPVLLLLLAAYFIIPRVVDRLRETELWDQVIERLGGEKLRLLQFEREIAKLKRSGDHAGAARLYEQAEWYPEAIESYVEAEDYNSAGAIYEQLDDHNRAAEMFVRGDDWKRAARMYASAGNAEKAGLLFEEHGQKIDAAKFFFDAGSFQKAAVLFESVSYFPQAGQCYEKLNQPLKAAENYEQHWTAMTSVGGGGLISAPSEREAKLAFKAGQLYEQAGEIEKAIHIYNRSGLAKKAAELNAKSGNYALAGDMYLKEEQLDQAAVMFEKAGDTTRASLIRGEIAFQGDDNLEAARHFMEGGDALRAAELYESEGSLEEAASCYENSGAPLQAANVYLRANNKEKSASMFEAAREFGTAAKLYEEIGNKTKASELYEANNHHFEAGMLAKEGTDPNRAIRLLQQVDSSHEQHESAVLALCRLFIQQKKGSFAEEKLKRLLANRDVSSQTLEHFYVLGLTYESLGQKDKAIDVFRKVMSERYGYEDVEERITALNTPAPASTGRTGKTEGPSKPPATGGFSAITTSPDVGNPLAPRPQAAPAQPTRSQAPAATTSVAKAPSLQDSAPNAPTPVPPQPAAATPFKLVSELGQGLLGKTYKAIDTRNQQAVAIKLPRADLLNRPDNAKRFAEETNLARNLNHPGLARFFGITEIQGHKAIVTEFVDGFSLKHFLEQNRRLSAKQALDLLTSLAKALAYAHQEKLIHHNVKTANVIIGQGGKLRLTGIGLGTLRTPQLGVADGYPAPEFLAGNYRDPRSDVFSLGAMVIHSVGGKPSNGANPAQYQPDVPESLRTILDRCCAHDPNQRFAHAVELVQAVDRVSVAS